MTVASETTPCTYSRCTETKGCRKRANGQPRSDANCMRIEEIRPRRSNQVTRSLGCKCSFAKCTVHRERPKLPQRLEGGGEKGFLTACNNCSTSDLHSGETAAPPTTADTPKDRAAFRGGQNVLFTPLGCSECLKLQVVVLHSRGCKRHVCNPGLLAVLTKRGAQ